MDEWLRFRFFTAGKLTYNDWLDCSKPDADEQAEVIHETHNQLAELANEQNLPWMVEIYDPAMGSDDAYMRMGTDTDMMVDPQEVGFSSE
jgi:hypothetical protein